MGEPIVLTEPNGSARSPMSRARDYVTVGKVQRAVDILLDNDRKLNENDVLLSNRISDLDEVRARYEREMAELFQSEIQARQHASRRIDDLERRLADYDRRRLRNRLARLWARIVGDI